MFYALLGQDIRGAFTGPLVLWFVYAKGMFLYDAAQIQRSSLSVCDFGVHEGTR